MSKMKKPRPDRPSAGEPGDDGHEARLIRLISRLDEAGSCDEGEAQFLLECVRAEFEAEEALMDRHGYPDLPRHRRQHQEILSEAANGDGDGSGHHDRLCAWVRQHVLSMDWEYGRYLMRLSCRGFQSTGKSFPPDSLESS